MSYPALTPVAAIFLYEPKIDKNLVPPPGTQSVHGCSPTRFPRASACPLILPVDPDSGGRWSSRSRAAARSRAACAPDRAPLSRVAADPAAPVEGFARDDFLQSRQVSLLQFESVEKYSKGTETCFGRTFLDL